MSAGPTASSGGPGTPEGNVVIADQYNNRVIEIDKTGKIVWSFGDGTSTPGPTSVIGPNDAERLPNGKTLIAGTGIPTMGPGCPTMGGCADNRVLIVDNATGKIDITITMVGTGANMTAISAPVSAVALKTGNLLITDQGNQRVIEIDMTGNIVWQFGTTGMQAMTKTDPMLLNNPNSAERLDNGNTLIADENDDRVIEVSPTKSIVWTYPDTPDPTKLSGAAFASRLPNGNTLITDSNNNRILEVSAAKAVVWSYTTNMDKGSNTTPLPTRGIRLMNGDTLISDQNNNRVIEVNNAKQIVFTYGMLNMAGSMAGQLSGPYDAKVVGDYTGLTPPL
jgi:hypothetical protein